MDVEQACLKFSVICAAVDGDLNRSIWRNVPSLVFNLVLQFWIVQYHIFYGNGKSYIVVVFSTFQQSSYAKNTLGNGTHWKVGSGQVLILTFRFNLPNKSCKNIRNMNLYVIIKRLNKSCSNSSHPLERLKAAPIPKHPTSAVPKTRSI